MPIQPGTLIESRYRVDALLGEGGMGAVYRATDTRLNQVVALKESLEFPDAEKRRSTDPTAAARLERIREQFLREAQILASLRHPSLPRVFDYFVVPDQGQYLVMDYIDGQDLQVLLNQAGPLSAQRVMTIGLDLCDVLAYLHGQDPPVIHRDVKPTNVRVTPQGRVVLVDFGVSKEGVGQLTKTAARAVSEGFSPLEQYGGLGKTDARSDVYSLGATLYALLSGESPPAATDRAAGHAVPRLAARLPAASPELQALLDRALELKPADRYPSVVAMRVALQAAQAARPAVGMEPPPARTRTPEVGEGVSTRAVADTTRGGVTLPHGEVLHPSRGPNSATRARTIGLAFSAIAVTAVLVVIARESRPRHDRRLLPSSSAAPPRAPVVQAASRDTSMVLIPAGTFLAGSPPDEPCRGDDETEHRVTLRQAFYMSDHEVTQAEWRAVTGTNPSHFQGDQRPVEQVSWFDCVNFCNAKSDREGLQRTYAINGNDVRCDFSKDGYRLPTEAEWEYACRAGTSRAFYNGGITN